MKKRVKKIFVQSTHIYRNDILVCVDATWEDVTKFAKPELIKKIEPYKNLFNEVLLGKQMGYAVNCDGWLFLILPKFKDNWDYWEVLIHELHHIVFYLSETKMLEKEMEAQAYLFEWLFRQIRRKLQGVEKS